VKPDKYEEDLTDLIDRGLMLQRAMYLEHYPDDFKAASKKLYDTDEKLDQFLKSIPNFAESYQSWYSEALELLRQVLPSRVDDFIEYYKPTRPRKKIDPGSYTVSDYLDGLIITNSMMQETANPKSAFPKFRQQVKIVEGLKRRFSSTLYDIRTLVQADLFDNELDVADELLNKGFLRAAGAVAGVVLEGHLGEVCTKHSIKVMKKSPTIADYNDALKAANVIDTTV
jgi:hypothetical protein